MCRTMNETQQLTHHVWKWRPHVHHWIEPDIPVHIVAVLIWVARCRGGIPRLLCRRRGVVLWRLISVVGCFCRLDDVYLFWRIDFITLKWARYLAGQKRIEEMKSRISPLPLAPRDPWAGQPVQTAEQIRQRHPQTARRQQPPAFLAHSLWILSVPSVGPAWRELLQLLKRP